MEVLDIAGIERLQYQNQLAPGDLCRDSEGTDARHAHAKRSELADRVAVVGIHVAANGQSKVAAVPPKGSLRAVTTKNKVEAFVMENLASAVNIDAFDLGNAIGAALGGGVIAARFGYLAVALAGAATSVIGLAAAALAVYRQPQLVCSTQT